MEAVWGEFSTTLLGTKGTGWATDGDSYTLEDPGVGMIGKNEDV